MTQEYDWTYVDAVFISNYEGGEQDDYFTKLSFENSTDASLLVGEYVTLVTFAKCVKERTNVLVRIHLTKREMKAGSWEN